MNDLRWGNFSIEHPGAHEHGESRITAAFFTARGTLRQVDITPEEALRAIRDLSGYLLTLDRVKR